MRDSHRTAANTALTAAMVLGLLTAPVVLVPGPPPGPLRSIQVRAGTVRPVPEVSAARRDLAVGEIERTLRSIYMRAFIRPRSELSASPSPSAASLLRAFMTPGAERALRRSSGVFDAHGLVLTSGTVVVSGLITFTAGRPLGAYLRIDFAGRAVRAGRPSAPIDLSQSGRVQLAHRTAGWVVSGFDLRLATMSAPAPRR